VRAAAGDAAWAGAAVRAAARAAVRAAAGDAAWAGARGAAWAAAGDRMIDGILTVLETEIAHGPRGGK
jgi:hypothetical protein